VLVVGFTSQSEQLLAVGFSLVALAATELAAREHFAGFRSHSLLLGLILGAVTAVVLVVAGAPRVVQIAAAVAMFAAGAWALRRAFQDRTGGMGFRA
jgi:cobalamin synthase